jgi:hypothetical protein
VPGAEIKIQENQPGRAFTASITFPSGYEVPQGQGALLTIKSSHPNYPVIKVPITQQARINPPVVPVQPAGNHASIGTGNPSVPAGH